jgi:isopentenyl diphosphate isomerase/L-lactate dehydrogenase-like FMN-dependent dehydrogenase
MKLQSSPSIDDLRRLCKARVPRMFYDYCETGSYSTGTFQENTTAFEKYKLRQCVAVNIDNRSLKTKIVGQEAVMPRALQIIYKELDTTMALCGEREIANVGRHNIAIPVQSHLTPKIKKRIR